MSSSIEDKVKESAAATGMGIGILMYPAVAGAFAAGTPVVAIAGITSIISVGIAGCSYGAVSAMYSASALIAGQDKDKEKEKLQEQAKEIGGNLVADNAFVAKHQENTDKTNWTQAVTSSRMSGSKPSLSR